MKKTILSVILCVCFGLLGTLGCEKKSKEEKAIGDATKQVEKAADKAASKAEDMVDEVTE